MDDGFEPAGQFSPGQQDTSLATAAFQSDIGAQADNFPFVPSTGVRLAQAHNIVNVQVGQHIKDYTIPMI